MKKANFILFILIVLLVFPTVTSAKSQTSSHSFSPLGTSVISHTYENIPFQIFGATLSVQLPPLGNEERLSETYDFGNRLYNAKAIHFIQTSAWALEFPDGAVIGEITVCYKDSTCEPPLQLIIGVNTDEWAYDRPGNQEFLNHTTVEPAYSEWTIDEFDTIPFLAHSFYVSVKTDSKKILGTITLDLADLETEYPDNPNGGVAIQAITVEVAEAPPVVIGSGRASCEGHDCGIGVSAYTQNSSAWPIGDVFFEDLAEGNTFIARDIRRYGKSSTSPGAIFFTGWGQVNNIDGYNFTLFVTDNGEEGDTFTIEILNPDGSTLYDLNNVPLVEGNIIVKTK